MLKLFCSSCGGQTPYGALKPSFCSFCSEPFVKKPVVAARPTLRGALPAKSVADRVAEMDAAQEELPISFDIRAEGAAHPKGGQRIIVDDAFVKSVPSFDRSGAGGGTGDVDMDRELSQVRQDAFKRLMDTTPVR